VIVVPGLAVHAYAEPPVRHLRDNGYDATLLSPPTWRGIDHDLERYGRNLAADIDREGAPVDVLIGLSVGTQAAAVAASSTSWSAVRKTACEAGWVSDLDPTEVVASFDSASVLHAATVAALNGQPFPHLGSSALAGLAVRAASRLPWSLLRGVYTRIGASEGINPKRLGDVNLAAVAESFANEFQAVVRRHGAAAHFEGLDPGRFPHDIGTLDRYGRVFDQLPRARHPWSPLPVDDALGGLAAAGLSVTTS
jgi:hypothetical protein